VVLYREILFEITYGISALRLSWLIARVAVYKGALYRSLYNVFVNKCIIRPSYIITTPDATEQITSQFAETAYNLLKLIQLADNRSTGEIL
jgi:hypothetical protein